MSAVAVPPTVKGWCPGALRPMESGDGLLVRVRITGGIVPMATFRALAVLARRHGNGLVDLSQRANLQIRGVRPDTLDPLTANLDDLGVLDADPAAERVRNVIGSPLAGLDPSARVDGRPIVEDLERRLSADDELHGLPDKFGFVVDDGGRIPLDDVAADVRLLADGEGVRLALGGDADTAPVVARIPASAAADGATALARAFLDLRARTGARRMRTLVAELGPAAVAVSAGLAPCDPLPRLRRPRPRLVGAEVGIPGVAAPFGRLTADQMEAIAGTGADEVRLTPWRLLLLPGAPARALTELGAAGLITEPNDPRRAVVACPGSSGCASGSVDTRVAAATLAPLAAGWDGVVLHVSGCPKGCARPAPTTVTLVGRDGRFDLVLGGRADAVPARTGMDLPAAKTALADALARRRDET